MEFVLNLRAVGESKSHAAQNRDGLIANQRERVQSADRQLARGKCRVDAGKRGAVGDFLQGRLF